MSPAEPVQLHAGAVSPLDDARTEGGVADRLIRAADLHLVPEPRGLITDDVSLAPSIAHTDEMQLNPDEIRTRAKQGAAVLVARGLAIRAAGFAGNIVLARLLTPADFGAVAIGAALTVFISYLSDGGLGTALIRGDHKPSRTVLEQLLGLQLGIVVALNVVVFACAPIVGRPGWVAAVMTSGLCLAVFQAPGYIYLERHLMFSRIATIEVVQNVSYLVWAIGTALLGIGVWSLATANVVQVAVGTVLVLWLAPTRIWRPRFGLSRIRPLLSFGVRFQAISVVNLARDQGLNIGIAAVAGVGTLGIWTMAYRFIQVPFLLFESLWRVTFPGMARLIETGEDPRPVVERLLRRSSVLTGAIMATMVGALPALIPAVFPPAWHPIVDILPWACAGLLVSGPVSVACAGFLFARGDASTALRGTILHTAAWLLAALLLLPVLGVAAIGIGAFLSSMVDGLVLGGRAKRTYGIKIVGGIIRPTLAALVAAGLGWAAAVHITPHLLGAIVGAGLSFAFFASTLAMFDRAAVADLFVLVTRGLRGELGRRRPIAAPAAE